MYGSDGSRPLDYERAEVVKAGKKDLPGSRRKTLLSEWISLLKKCLTGPTLLEMSGNTTDQELTDRRKRKTDLRLSKAISEKRHTGSYSAARQDSSIPAARLVGLLPRPPRSVSS